MNTDAVTAQFAIDKLMESMFTPAPKPWVFYTRDCRNCSSQAPISDAGPYVERGRFATEAQAKAFAESYNPPFPDCWFWSIVGREEDDEVQVFSDGEWKHTTESMLEAA